MRTGDLDHMVQPNYIPSAESESKRPAGRSQSRGKRAKI
jgi:hypothetical protein